MHVGLARCKLFSITNLLGVGGGYLPVAHAVDGDD